MIYLIWGNTARVEQIRINAKHWQGSCINVMPPIEKYQDPEIGIGNTWVENLRILNPPFS